MILLFSLLINTGFKEYDFACRFIFLMMTSIYLELQTESTQHDFLVHIKNLHPLDLSRIPQECQESFLLALNILKQFENDKHIQITLVYMHEQFGQTQRRLASCQYQQKIFYIYLSRTVLTKHLFSRENLKSVIYHEIGHFLNDEGLKNASNYDMLRMWLLTCLNTGMSILIDELKYSQTQGIPYYSFLAIFFIFAILQIVVLKLQDFELQADMASVTHGNVSPIIVIQTLEKIHQLWFKRKTLPGYLILNPQWFSSHPNLSKRIRHIQKLEADYQPPSPC